MDVISLIGTKLGSYLMKYFQHPISKQKLLTKTLTKDDSYDIVTLAHPLLFVNCIGREPSRLHETCGNSSCDVCAIDSGEDGKGDPR